MASENGKNFSQKMQSEISEKLEGAFEAVVKQKNEYYENNPQKIPQKSSTKSLISSVALTNSAISGGSSLIPGPWGMLAVVPELIVVIRNQIALIYDIAAANGKKDIMTKELAAMVFASALGTGTGGFLIVQGGRYVIKRASLQVFQKIIVMLGGKITQQVLKSTISKWLPGVGAAAMAAWTNYMTRQVGKKAEEIFSSEIEFEDNISDIELIRPIEENLASSDNPSRSLDFYKIKTLINLMKIDGNNAIEEIEYLTPLINNSDLTTEDKELLTTCLTNTDHTLDGIEKVAASPSDSIALLADLVALSKIDGHVHITEKLYIKQIGKLLNFSEADIEEFLA